jgi:hypothetical protein
MPHTLWAEVRGRHGSWIGGPGRGLPGAPDKNGTSKVAEAPPFRSSEMIKDAIVDQIRKSTYNPLTVPAPQLADNATAPRPLAQLSATNDNPSVSLRRPALTRTVSAPIRRPSVIVRVDAAGRNAPQLEMRLSTLQLPSPTSLARHLTADDRHSGSNHTENEERGTVSLRSRASMASSFMSEWTIVTPSEEELQPLKAQRAVSMPPPTVARRWVAGIALPKPPHAVIRDMQGGSRVNFVAGTNVAQRTQSRLSSRILESSQGATRHFSGVSALSVTSDTSNFLSVLVERFPRIPTSLQSQLPGDASVIVTKVKNDSNQGRVALVDDGLVEPVLDASERFSQRPLYDECIHESMAATSEQSQSGAFNGRRASWIHLRSSMPSMPSLSGLLAPDGRDLGTDAPRASLHSSFPMGYPSADVVHIKSVGNVSYKTTPSITPGNISRESIPLEHLFTSGK